MQLLLADCFRSLGESENAIPLHATAATLSEQQAAEAHKMHTHSGALVRSALPGLCILKFGAHDFCCNQASLPTTGVWEPVMISMLSPSQTKTKDTGCPHQLFSNMKHLHLIFSNVKSFV